MRAFAAHTPGPCHLGAGCSFNVVDSQSLRPTKDLNKNLFVCSGDRKYLAAHRKSRYPKRLISLHCSVMVDRLYRAISRNSLIRSSSRSGLARSISLFCRSMVCFTRFIFRSMGSNSRSTEISPDTSWIRVSIPLLIFSKYRVSQQRYK